MRVLVPLVFAVAMMEAAEAAPIPSAYPSTIGKDYAHARRILLARGARPLELQKPQDGCSDSGACQFPELYSCFADQPVCMFDWRAPGGGYLRVFVDRDWRDIDKLTVSYISRMKTEN